MKLSCLSVGLAMVLVSWRFPSALAQGEKPPARLVMITAGGWFLEVFADGAGGLQYGSLIQDGWRFKAGTFDAKKVMKDLQALPSDEKGRLGTHFVLHFESERKGTRARRLVIRGTPR